MPEAISTINNLPVKKNLAFLEAVCIPVKKELSEVEKALGFLCGLPELKPLLKNGKRLRPAMVLLSSLFGRGDCPDAARLAAAVEILHLASLVHDDIIDCSAERRGLPTINKLYGDKVAILAGDYLFFLFLEQCASLGINVLSSLAVVLKDMIKAEFAQQRELFNLEIPEKKYLKKIYQKTGAFFSCCCKLGALLSGARPDAVSSLERFGLFWGISFQITDDLLDFLGNSASTGKPVCNDIASGVLTLPIIHALKYSPNKSTLREMIAGRNMTVSNIKYIINDLRDSGSFDYAAGLAEKYAMLAERSIAALPAGPARDSLHALVEIVTKRDY